jgi:micrococcal nuclease
MLNKDASGRNIKTDPSEPILQTGVIDSLGDLIEDILKSSGVLKDKPDAKGTASRRKTPEPKPSRESSGSKDAGKTRADDKPNASSVSEAQLAKALYFYKAIVREVYDGDTMTVDIDLGLRHWVHEEKLRLLRINAPEVKGESSAAGIKSRDFVRKMVLGKSVVIETFKDDQEKYGRYLAEVWVEDPHKKGQYINLNDCLVKEGLAKYQQY